MASSKAAQARKALVTARMATVRAIEDADRCEAPTAIEDALRRAAQSTRGALRPQSVRVAL